MFAALGLLRRLECRRLRGLAITARRLRLTALRGLLRRRDSVALRRRLRGLAATALRRRRPVVVARFRLAIVVAPFDLVAFNPFGLWTLTTFIELPQLSESPP